MIKFDPLSDPELATGAEAIGTRIFWALGYNVPENYLVHFRPEDLQIGPKATLRLLLGRRRPFTPYDLEILLSKVPKRPDGSIRAIASRYLPGMAECGRGAVLNIASVAAFQPLPGSATYAASKSFVLSFSEALHTEQRGSGVTITAVCPASE